MGILRLMEKGHTNYDELLMRGTDRLDTQALVREKIDRVLAEWK
jgi:hypothetical protein